MEHPLLPPDATKEHMYFLLDRVADIYTIVHDPTDMFLVAYCLELGYPQYTAANILNVSESRITQRIGAIRQRLKDHYAKLRRGNPLQ
jgi:hypothetical protein